jgi:hypothetical protein
MDERESVPFPFLSGMIVRVNTAGGQIYYKVGGQAQQTILTAPYLIGPNLNSLNLQFTIGQVNAFQTSDTLLKQWVTWVDNEYLGVQWTINGTTLPLLNGQAQYLTVQTSPPYSYDIQFFSVGQINIQAAYNLFNLNTLAPIRGVLKVVLATTSVKQIPQPPANQPFTDISIGGIQVATSKVS